MIFYHKSLIAHSTDLSRYWKSHVRPFIYFPSLDADGGTIDFSRPLDYFDLTSDNAERLRKIGEPYDFYTNTLPVSLPSFTVNIFDGFNDENGIGEKLRQFTMVERERSCYAVYASYYAVQSSVYCAITICRNLCKNDLDKPAQYDIMTYR